MEQPRLEPRCRVCAIFTRAPKLWHELHEQVLYYRYPIVEVTKWLNSRVASLNAGLDSADPTFVAEFSATNLRRHFKAHVTDMEAVNAVMSNGGVSTGEKPARHEPLREGQLELPPVDDAVDDYLRLHKLVTAAECRLDDYENRYQADKQGGEEPIVIDLAEIQTFQKLVKELMGMKKELAVFQTREAVAGSAIRETIEILATQMMSQLKDSLIEMETNLGREMPGSALPKQMNSLVLNKTGNFIKDLAPKVLEEIYLRYKIK